MVCHGETGEGQREANFSQGYLYPPLWGEDSYNHGAGMHRVITAAEFIKGNMPFGEATWDNPKLSDEEAYHVAAYINSMDRPLKANVEKISPTKNSNRSLHRTVPGQIVFLQHSINTARFLP